MHPRTCPREGFIILNSRRELVLTMGLRLAGRGLGRRAPAADEAMYQLGPPVGSWAFLQRRAIWNEKAPP